ncbi:hypothetical protein ACROYT_G012287 [Oculina patagonica]
MKRLNRNFTISKLGESVHNALKMKTEVDGDEKRILHYSYNFASDTEQKRHSFPAGENSYGELKRKNPLFRSERITNALNKEETLLRSSSFSFSGRHMFNNETEKVFEPPKAKNMLFYGGTTQGYVENFTADFSMETNTENPVTENNGSREARTRKVGLGDTTNRGLMSHRLRKKAVCDSSDNFHYQRQFLRVLNKRF